MDFRYIKSASSCPPNCAKTGQMGPTPTGQDGLCCDTGIDLTTPVVTTWGGTTTPNVIGTGNQTEGKEITCVSIEVLRATAKIVPDQLLGYIFIVTYSDGTTNWKSNNGIPGASAVWSSSDDDIAEFQNPTYWGDGPDGYAYYVRGKAVGDVTISVHYSHPSGKDIVGSAASNNYYGACDLTGEATLSVVAVPDPNPPEPDPSPLNPPTIDPVSVARLVDLEILGDMGIAQAGFVEVGRTWQFNAQAVYSNGDRVIVTNFAAWSSADTGIATIDKFGMAVGIAVGPASTTVSVVITATYQGKTAAVNLQVAAPAEDATIHGNAYTVAPIDTVLVLDRSASMLARDEQGLSRVQRARDAALAFLNNQDQPDSQIAMVSFAGVWIIGANPGDPAQTEADATLELLLTTDRREIRAALNEFNVRGPCAIAEGEGTRCATGIGAALLAAQAEVNSDRRAYGHKPMILLLTDGCENVDKPAPQAVADDIKTEGTLIAVIALDAPECATDLEALASPGLYFSSPTAYELAYQMAQVTHFANYSEYGYAWYA